MRSSRHEVGRAGQQPGGVGAGQVVEPGWEVDPLALTAGSQMRVPARVGNSTSSCPMSSLRTCSAMSAFRGIVRDVKR